jgi:hypothetical protein
LTNISISSIMSYQSLGNRPTARPLKESMYTPVRPLTTAEQLELELLSTILHDRANLHFELRTTVRQAGIRGCSNSLEKVREMLIFDQPVHPYTADHLFETVDKMDELNARMCLLSGETDIERAYTATQARISALQARVQAYQDSIERDAPSVSVRTILCGHPTLGHR